MEGWQPVLDRLGLLVASWPAPPWSWDSRFNAVAASFAIALEPKVRESAMTAFPRGWTLKTIEAAPAALRAFVDTTGGLRARQRLLAGDELLAPTLFGLWWPWGNGETITLRIGVLGADANAEPMPRIRALFGVAG
jgi:hypothetical protein